jgi:hypothetical protein
MATASSQSMQGFGVANHDNPEECIFEEGQCDEALTTATPTVLVY